jgi:prephenate dehydratase
VNVLSIHSRRCLGGGLHFLLEIEGHASEESLQKVIEYLKSSGVNLKVCGSYPRAN